MRSFSVSATVIGAALLMFGAMPGLGRADIPAAPVACDGPGPMPPHSVAPRHHVRWRDHCHCRPWHWHWHPLPVAVLPPAPPELVPPLAYYNPPLPSPYDTAYDRTMTLHLRSVAVTGIYRADLGWPPTPPLLGIQPYTVSEGGRALQYDATVGQYIPLAQADIRPAAPPR